MVDGILVPLSDKPGMHSKAYFDCKSHYSLSLQVCPSCGSLDYFNSYFTQVINMPSLHIINYVLGPMGSMHDATAFKLSDMAKDPTAWFTDHEWVWADSAYALQPWCIIPYKKPHSLIQNNETFNYYLSKVCNQLLAHP
jgi:DDE superfamily endonuclease